MGLFTILQSVFNGLSVLKLNKLVIFRSSGSFLNGKLKFKSLKHLMRFILIKMDSKKKYLYTPT